MDPERRSKSELKARPEISVKVAAPTTVNYLLGREITEPYGSIFTLGGKPIHICAVSDSQSGSTEYLAILNHGLEGFSFYLFLHAVAPNKDDSLLAVKADFELSDLKDGYHGRFLLPLHKEALREDWNEFERHRPAFLETIRYRREHLESQLNTAMSFEKAKKAFLAGYYWRRWWRSSHVRNFRNRFVQYLKDNGENWVEGSSLNAISQKLNKNKSKRNRVLTGFFEALNEDEKRQLIHAYAQARDGFVASMDDWQGTVYKDRKGFKVESKGVGRIQININNVISAQAQLTEVNGLIRGDLLGETVKSTNFIVPVIRWRKDGDGKRTWQFDFLEDAEDPVAKCFWEFSKPLIDSSEQEGLDFDLRRFNPLAGLLAVAYFSPAVRRNWPKHKRLPRRAYEEIGQGDRERRPQFMGAVQVTGFALQVRQRIMQKSPFPEAAENHLEQTAT